MKLWSILFLIFACSISCYGKSWEERCQTIDDNFLRIRCLDAKYAHEEGDCLSSYSDPSQAAQLKRCKEERALSSPYKAEDYDRVEGQYLCHPYFTGGNTVTSLSHGSSFCGSIKTIAHGLTAVRCIEKAFEIENDQSNSLRNGMNWVTGLATPNMAVVMCSKMKNSKDMHLAYKCFETAPKNWLYNNGLLCNNVISEEDIAFKHKCISEYNHLLRHDTYRAELCSQATDEDEFKKAIQCINKKVKNEGYRDRFERCLQVVEQDQEALKKLKGEATVCGT